MLLAAGRVRLAAGGRGAEAGIGLAGGVLGGLAGLSGVLPTVWAALKGWPKEERRSIFQVFNTTILSAMLLVSLVQGLIDLRFLAALAVALPATMIGARLGSLLYRPPRRPPLRPHCAPAAAPVGAWAGVVEPLSVGHISGRLLGENAIVRIGMHGMRRSMAQSLRALCDVAASGRAGGPGRRCPAAAAGPGDQGCGGERTRDRGGEEGARDPQGLRTSRSAPPCTITSPTTGDVTCNVQKTWRKEVLTKIMERGKIAWPWGNARCMGDLKVDRATLIKGMTEPEFEAQFDKHDLRCELEGEKEKYEVKLQIHPKVTFKQGKAVKAKLNWGNIEAPRLAKTAFWSATAADNSFGVLQGVLVDDINDFIQTRCMEVKEEWQGK